MRQSHSVAHLERMGEDDNHTQSVQTDNRIHRMGMFVITEYRRRTVLVPTCTDMSGIPTSLRNNRCRSTEYRLIPYSGSVTAVQQSQKEQKPQRALPSTGTIRFLVELLQHGTKNAKRAQKGSQLKPNERYAGNTHRTSVDIGPLHNEVRCNHGHESK